MKMAPGHPASYKENLIIIVLNAPEEAKALQLMKEVDTKRLQQQGGKHER